MLEQREKLTQDERLANIRAMCLAVENGDVSKVNAEGQKLVDELKQEKAAEDFVVKHGLLDARKEDVEDETDFLETEKKDDFDVDESITNMEIISPLMREVKEG